MHAVIYAHRNAQVALSDPFGFHASLVPVQLLNIVFKNILVCIIISSIFSLFFPQVLDELDFDFFGGGLCSYLAILEWFLS